MIHFSFSIFNNHLCSRDTSIPPDFSLTHASTLYTPTSCLQTQLGVLLKKELWLLYLASQSLYSPLFWPHLPNCHSFLLFQPLASLYTHYKLYIYVCILFYIYMHALYKHIYYKYIIKQIFFKYKINIHKKYFFWGRHILQYRLGYTWKVYALDTFSKILNKVPITPWGHKITYNSCLSRTVIHTKAFTLQLKIRQNGNLTHWLARWC